MNAKGITVRIRLKIMLITQALSLGLNAPSYAAVDCTDKKFIGKSEFGVYINMCDSPLTCDSYNSSEVCDKAFCEGMYEYYNGFYGDDAGCFQCEAGYNNETCIAGTKKCKFTGDKPSYCHQHNVSLPYLGRNLRQRRQRQSERLKLNCQRTYVIDLSLSL